MPPGINFDEYIFTHHHHPSAFSFFVDLVYLRPAGIVLLADIVLSVGSVVCSCRRETYELWSADLALALRAERR